MAEIKFDEAEVNTNLAKEYLKNNKIFKSKGFNDSKESASNDYNNTIQFTEYKRTTGSVVLRNDVNDVPEKLYNLAQKIEENADLFCQLELLIRKIPLEDTKSIDLKLIIQNIIHYSSTRPQAAKTTAREIVLAGDSPLLILGCVAQVLLARMPRVVIECTKETAPVCSLFTDLCHRVGLKEKVLLAILPQISDEKKSFKVTLDLRHITDFLDGGVGIVSGKSDVDSAVDTFIASSCRYPWTLNKIFVQECALERFKKALAWKSERAAGSPGGDVEVSCAATYRCGDKVFALEATGSCGTRVVALEAYRTVRELLALLGALRPLAASLWSSDVAESLEIAHGLSATVVWVNDFADFRGPPRVSQALYSVIDSYFSTRMMAYMPEFDEINKFREPWLRFSVEKRKDVVRNALSKIDYKVANKIIEAIKTLTFQMDSFVHVTKNMVSTGIELLPEILFKEDSHCHDSLDLSIICYIITGGAVLLHVPEFLVTSKANNVSYMFYEHLRILGAPVLFTKEDYKFGTIPILINPINRYKIIWTSYGTVFAN